MHPVLPALAAYPAEIAVPTPAQQVHITAALAAADQQLTAFLAAGADRDQYIDHVFGAGRRAAVVRIFQQMQEVVTKWSDGRLAVRVSDWPTRFGRAAETDGSTKRLTLPAAALGVMPVATLGRKILHESAHGVDGRIVDAAYGGAGFVSMLGDDRLWNAPHFDFTANAWQSQTPLANVVAGDPDAVPAPVVGGAMASAVALQFGRAQGLITHARIHAENMLPLIVSRVRTGDPAGALTAQAVGLRPPGATGPFTPADADQAARFSAALATLHGQVLGVVNRTIGQAAAVASCQIAGPTLQIEFTKDHADFSPVPIDGNVLVDPWVLRMLTAALVAFPPAPAADVTVQSLALVDQQYHKVRGFGPH